MPFSCRKCSYRAQVRPGGEVLCDRCWIEAQADQESQAVLAAELLTAGAVVGAQPAVCQHAECGRIFQAAGSDVRYCSATCRAKAWRERQHARASAA